MRRVALVVLVGALAAGCGQGAPPELVVSSEAPAAVAVESRVAATSTTTTEPPPPSTTTTRKSGPAPEYPRSTAPPGTVPTIPPVTPDPLQGDPDGAGGHGRKRVTVDGPVTMTILTYPNGPKGPGSAVQQWFANVRDELCRDVVHLGVVFGDGTGESHDNGQNTCRDHPEGWWWTGYPHHHYAAPGSYDLAVTFWLRNADGTNSHYVAHQRVVVTEVVPA